MRGRVCANKRVKRVKQVKLALFFFVLPAVCCEVLVSQKRTFVLVSKTCFCTTRKQALLYEQARTSQRVEGLVRVERLVRVQPTSQQTAAALAERARGSLALSVSGVREEAVESGRKALGGPCATLILPRVSTACG